ncbi:MAG: PorP/SprF family type IX secretion system membrane protein, partial [Opitutaceae bacterium]|nr:PorP/SprF family type IX secretion system membrane protein [Cytophagales bacterium]
MLKKILLSCFITTLAYSVNAQDFHFSQFYNSPLTLNPALTGRIREDFRVGIIHRNQWKAINSAYVTSAVFADINFIKNPFKLDMWGVGLVAMNDEIGDGMFSNQNIGLSLSGTKTLDELKRHKLSIGVQPSYVTKGLNKNNLIFDN